MPKGLHALTDIPRAPDEDMAAEFLATFPESGTRSFYRGVERVRPGHVVSVTRTALETRPHWRWAGRPLHLRDRREYVEGFRCHLDLAVRAQLRGAEGGVAAQLSAGFDSSAVVATAARTIAPSGGKITAFTAVPRAGYDLPPPFGRFADEGPLAAATTALYPNIEHVLIRGDNRRSPLATLDRDFFLFERPLMNLCNYTWVHAINDAVKARGLTVLLTGMMGNLTISYDGRELLPELIRQRRWRQWAGAATAIVRHGQWRFRGVLAASFSPWLPPWLWQWISRVYAGQANDIRRYSAISAACITERDLAARARSREFDFTYRPAKNGLAARLAALSWVDLVSYVPGQD